jgi:hypothetical protein
MFDLHEKQNTCLKVKTINNNKQIARPDLAQLVERIAKKQKIMRRISHILALGLVVLATASCRPRPVAATPGEAAKQYVEHIMRGDYEAFVEGVSFADAPPTGMTAGQDRAHAEALRAIHMVDVNDRGGIREVRVISERPSADNRICDVILASHYHDGLVKTVSLHMVNDYDVWKIRETPYKEIWRATTSEGDTEVVKVHDGATRDFIKAKDRVTGAKEFIKDIDRHNGEVEVVKVLEGGRRHREVIRTMDDGTIVDTVVK